MWDLEALAEAALGAIELEADRLRAEQATVGVDFLTEIEVHPILRQAFASTGLGAAGELRYPGGASARKRTSGERCDIVLTESPGLEVSIDAPAPLFAHRLVEPEDALWIEVKVIAQHVLYEGYSRPNPNYTSEFLQGLLADITKLSREGRIAHAAVLLVLFTQDKQTAHHDIAAWHKRALDKAHPVSMPVTRTCAIPDLIGHARCTVALARVHNL